MICDARCRAAADRPKPFCPPSQHIQIYSVIRINVKKKHTELNTVKIKIAKSVIISVHEYFLCSGYVRYKSRC